MSAPDKRRTAEAADDGRRRAPIRVLARFYRRSKQRLLRRKRATSPWHFFSDFPTVVPYMRRYWKLLTASLSIVFVSAAIGLAAPWPLAIIIDSVLSKKPVPGVLQPLLSDPDRYLLLALAAASGLVLSVLANGISVVENYVNTKIEQRTTVDFRSALFSHAQQLSLSFHDRIPAGGLMYRINLQSSSMGAIAVAFPPLGQALLMLIGMFVIAYNIDSTLALLSLTAVPFMYYSIGYYAKKVEPTIYRVRNLEGQSLTIVYEAMSMLRVIIAFGRERYEYRRFRQQADRAVDARLELTLRQTLFSLAIGTITAAGTSLVLGIGALHVIEGKLTVGALTVLLGYVAAIYQPLQQISYTVSSLQQHFVGLRSVLELLELEADIQDVPDAVEISRARGAVSFENVSFVYRSPALEKLAEKQRGKAVRKQGRISRRVTALLGRAEARAQSVGEEDHFAAPLYEIAGMDTAPRQPALTDVSFDVQPGQRVGIVGPTGAGKSTLVSLIPRFYDVADGSVSLDGVDVRRLSVRSLREQISLVQQEPLLFAGTIYDNIRYGNLDATDEEIEQAARGANAHDFIMRFPKQYLTVIGERGSQVSGGERQRICIARAFLRDAPILILDEPTSSVDSKTEAVILDALERLMEGRTTFIVAHRLASVRSAAAIFVLDDGRIVEQGKHEELVALGGLYAQLWAAQTGQLDPRELVTSMALVVEEQAPNVEPPGPEHLRVGAALVNAVVDALRERSLQKVLARGESLPPRGRRFAAALVVAIADAMWERSLDPLHAMARSLSGTGLPRQVAQALIADEADEAGLRRMTKKLHEVLEQTEVRPLRIVALREEPWIGLVDPGVVGNGADSAPVDAEATTAGRGA